MTNEPLVNNPFGEFKRQSEKTLRKTIKKLYNIDFKNIQSNLKIPPSKEFGDLASTISFEISKRLEIKPFEVASNIAERIDLSDANLIKSVEKKDGYINLHLNYAEFTKITLNSIQDLEENYGFVKVRKSEKIIVEHSSFNPIHAIHIGQARSPVLGDSLFRLLKRRGHRVARHFYVDDTGRQSAIIAYGYRILGEPTPSTKPDHFLSQIYSIMNYLLEINRLENLLFKSKNSIEINETKKKLREWIEIGNELKERNASIFKKLEDGMKKIKDPEGELSGLLKDYELGKRSAKELIRKVSNLCLEGFKQTLLRMEIFFDSWDWESELIWSGKVERILVDLQKTRYISKVDNVIELDSEKVIEELKLRDPLSLSEDFKTPSVVLTRSDGTSLYVTRDIAYSLNKFKLAKRVINVIGSEQKLSQLHVKIALCAIGLKELALNQHHFAFGLVEFPQFKMSSRRGRTISLDYVMDEAIRIALEKVSGNSKTISEQEKIDIAKCISISAIKYALLSIEPSKNVTFTWDSVLNLKRNSAPFINYAFTRTKGILKKVGKIDARIEYKWLRDPLEYKLVFQLSRFPEIFIEACENLRPDIIANYANALAESFHEYYEKVDVSHVKDEELKLARAVLIKSIQICLRNAMEILGIELAEKM
jgi:arginyl-tRNA synthetase